jgi:exosome complex RNA-binding protein Rrp42 (RNase PH superfamily)
MLGEISGTEKDFIRHSCSHNIRYDGRSLTTIVTLLIILLLSLYIRNSLDFRLSQIENDIFPHCNGSSRVSIRNSIDVVCGVKLVVVSGLESSNYASVALDLSPSCLTKVDEAKANEITSRIEEILQANLNNSCLQHFANTLTIIPGKFSWSLRIDLIVCAHHHSLPLHLSSHRCPSFRFSRWMAIH